MSFTWQPWLLSHSIQPEQETAEQDPIVSLSGSAPLQYWHALQSLLSQQRAAKAVVGQRKALLKNRTTKTKTIRQNIKVLIFSLAKLKEGCQEVKNLFQHPCYKSLIFWFFYIDPDPVIF